MNGDRPPLDPTRLTRAGWQRYAENAREAVHAASLKGQRDPEAEEAMRQADIALEAYDQAEAAGPGERLRAGLGGAVRGLSHVPGDLLAGAVTLPIGLVTEPTETIRGVLQTPAAIARNLSGEADPETVARTVGDVGTLLTPFARGLNAPGATGLRRLVPQMASRAAVRATMPVGAVLSQALMQPLRSARALIKLPETKMTEMGSRGHFYETRAQLEEARLRELEGKSRPLTDEQRVARALGIPEESVRGKVGEAAVARARAEFGQPQSSAAAPSAPAAEPLNLRGLPRHYFEAEQPTISRPQVGTLPSGADPAGISAGPPGSAQRPISLESEPPSGFMPGAQTEAARTAYTLAEAARESGMENVQPPVEAARRAAGFASRGLPQATAASRFSSPELAAQQDVSAFRAADPTRFREYVALRSDRGLRTPGALPEDYPVRQVRGTRSRNPATIARQAEAQGVRSPIGFTPATATARPGTILSQLFEASPRVTELLSGPPTAEAQATLAGILRASSPATRRALLARLTPEWRAALATKR